MDLKHILFTTGLMVWAGAYLYFVNVQPINCLYIAAGAVAYTLAAVAIMEG